MQSDPNLCWAHILKGIFLTWQLNESTKESRIRTAPWEKERILFRPRLEKTFLRTFEPQRPGSAWHISIYLYNIEIKPGFSYINIRQVPWEVLKTEAGGRGFQHLPRDLANVNALTNHVRSLLLHRNWKRLLHFAIYLALFCFAFQLMSRERNFHGLCLF